MAGSDARYWRLGADPDEVVNAEWASSIDAAEPDQRADRRMRIEDHEV